MFWLHLNKTFHLTDRETYAINTNECNRKRKWIRWEKFNFWKTGTMKLRNENEGRDLCSICKILTLIFSIQLLSINSMHAHATIKSTHRLGPRIQIRIFKTIVVGRRHQRKKKKNWKWRKLFIAKYFTLHFAFS